jgi:flagellar biosynthesis protein FlhB
MPGGAQDKTEKATPRKREDERKKGNIFQSADVVSALSILLIFTVLKIAFPYIYVYFGNFLIAFFGRIRTVSSLDISSAKDLLAEAWQALLLLCAPVMAASVLVAVLATGVQTRFKFSGEKIKFKLSNISPLQGFKRLFSLRSVIELLKSMIKIAICGYVLYLQIKGICNRCIDMMYGDVKDSAITILNSIMDLVYQISLAFIGLSAIDYFYQWWEYERNIRMSKQEVKEEFKQMEGNPEIKGKIRQLQRRMARQRMMQQVPTADVIVRNPTHFAVALRYDPKKDTAPMVVAKGQDYLALKIIDVASEYHIPMKEDKPLARALYSTVKVNEEIPAEFYKALAEVMAWVYQLKKERR